MCNSDFIKESKNEFFFLVFFVVGCALDLGLITPEDLQQIVSRGVKEGSTQEDEMSVEVCLELINLLTNIHVVRKDATH